MCQSGRSPPTPSDLQPSARHHLHAPPRPRALPCSHRLRESSLKNKSLSSTLRGAPLRLHHGSTENPGKSIHPTRISGRATPSPQERKIKPRHRKKGREMRQREGVGGTPDQ